MATIDLGKIKQVFRGTYNNATAYTIDDLVSFTDTVGGLQNTSTYIAVANTTGNAPASGGTIHASWNLLAQGVPDRLPSQSGQSGKFLTTNGSAVSFETITIQGNNFAIFELHDVGGNFRCYNGVAGVSGAQNNHQIQWNQVFDHGNILGTTGSNNWAVNTSGTYMLDVHFANHRPGHWRAPYVYNNTDSKPAGAYDGTGNNNSTAQFTFVGYVSVQDGVHGHAERYYLESGKTYSFRWSCDGDMAAFSSSTNYLLSNYSSGGVTQYNVVFRARLFKVSTPA